MKLMQRLLCAICNGLAQLCLRVAGDPIIARDAKQKYDSASTRQLGQFPSCRPAQSAVSAYEVLRRDEPAFRGRGVFTPAPNRTLDTAISKAISFCILAQ